MLVAVLIVASAIIWVAIWVIPFRHSIYQWYDQRFGR